MSRVQLSSILDIGLFGSLVDFFGLHNFEFMQYDVMHRSYWPLLLWQLRRALREPVR